MTDTLSWQPPRFDAAGPVRRAKSPFPAAIAAIFVAVLALVTLSLVRTAATAEPLDCDPDECPYAELTFSNVVGNNPGLFVFGIVCNATGIAVAALLILGNRSGVATTIAIALIGITFFCCTVAYLLDAMGRAMTASL